MNIIVRNSDNIVVIASENPISFVSDYSIVDGRKTLGIKSTTHKVFENVTLPQNFIPNVFSYVNDVFDIPDQEKYDQELATINAFEEKVLSELKEDRIHTVDKMTDEFIKSVVGERTNEYIIAEQEARDFKASNYTLDPIPLSILTDAQANNRTPQEACDDIIDMADQWRALQMQLRAYRLEAKSKIRQGQSEEDCNNFLNEFRIRTIELKQLV